MRGFTRAMGDDKMAPRSLRFPPIRACLFDMDGLLLNTEDIYTECTNRILAKYDRPALPWSVKAQLQGRPGPESIRIFHDWAGLPITAAEYVAELALLQKDLFPLAEPLPGVPELLSNLHRAEGVHVALATSSHRANFDLKTAHLPDLFAVFPDSRRVLGDDVRVKPGRGKPMPDIFLVALQTVNETLGEGERKIRPEECLVFEDSVPGVEAGRRAGMRVVWCPHGQLKEEFRGREEDVLAGRAGSDVEGHQLGERGDGWAEELATLEGFPYEKYGIVVERVSN